MESNETLSPTPSPIKRHAALPRRLMLLVMFAMAGGYALAQIDTQTVVGWYTAAACTALCAVVGVAWAWFSIARPLQRFIDQLDSLVLGQRSTQVRALPTARRDEIGRMADAVQQLIIHRIRDHHDARQLRRTLDARVTSATQRAVTELEKIAMRDPLTQLGNRRFLDQHLPTLIKASTASGTDLICIMIDMDNFKDVNDSLGHAVGDELLSLLGDLIRSAVRPDDVAVRYGGDEFILFMPGATLERGEQFTKHIRQLYTQRASVLLRQGVSTNLSVGLASLKEEPCQNGEQLIAQADQHLYQAKRRGKGVTWSVNGLSAA